MSVYDESKNAIRPRANVTSIRRRSPGRTILLRGIIIGFGGCLSLLLYIRFGPSEGNHIGLGLIALASTIPGCIGTATGSVLMHAEYAGHRMNG